jgi:hypothetical protein
MRTVARTTGETRLFLFFDVGREISSSTVIVAPPRRVAIDEQNIYDDKSRA